MLTLVLRISNKISRRVRKRKVADNITESLYFTFLPDIFHLLIPLSPAVLNIQTRDRLTIFNVDKKLITLVRLLTLTNLFKLIKIIFRKSLKVKV